MNTHHYTEEQLEDLARGAISSAKKLPLETEAHFRTCAMCRMKYEFVLQFHKNLGEEVQTPIDRRIARFVDESLYPNVIQLHPYRAEVDLASLGADKALLVLAAQGIKEDTGPFTTVGTFASEAHRVLVRVVEDRPSNRYRLHLLSEKEQAKRRARIFIVEQTGQAHALVTGDDGVAEFSAHPPIDWRSVSIALLMS